MTHAPPMPAWGGSPLTRQLRAGDLARVAAKVYAGEPLSRDDGLELYRTQDLIGLGHLAGLVRERLHGRRASYVVNAHLNPTNVCRHRCAFCAFAAPPGSPRGYDMDDREIEDRLRALGAQGVREIHMVGGVHPGWTYARYLDRVRLVRATLPGVVIKAYTAVEIDEMARLSGHGYARVLSDLVDAGLGILPGGGAEIFAPEIRRRICATKVDGAGWLAVHATAHEMGLVTNATMLYGHVERPEHKVDHLFQLRELQARAPVGGGFAAFVPLAFHPAGTRLDQVAHPTDRMALREIAVARLLLDGVLHVTAYWVMIGKAMAQTALSMGASDLSGTVGEERITYAAGGTSPRAMAATELWNLVLDAGYEPVERDGLYRSVVGDAA